MEPWTMNELLAHSQPRMPQPEMRNKKEKFLLRGTIVRILSPEQKSQYDFVLLSDDGRRYLCKLDADASCDNDIYREGCRALLLCNSHDRDTTLVWLVLQDTEAYRLQLADYVKKYNEKLFVRSEQAENDENKPFIPDNLPPGFSQLPQGLQDNILDQLGAPEYADKDIPTPYKMDKSDFKLKYNICKNTYPVEMRMVIEDLLKSHHKRADDKLKVAMINTRYHAETLNPKDFRKNLDKLVYGMEDAKDKLCSAIATSQRCGGSGLKILLVGPPGCGKTELMKAVMKLRQKPFFIASCGSLTSLVDTSGDDCLYDASKPGFFGENFLRTGTTDVTVGLDELDKIPTVFGKDGDPNACYINMLGDEAYYYDVFSTVKLNCKSTWFIATANDDSKLKPYIKSRFDYIIRIEEYTDEDRMAVAKKYFIPSICQKWEIAGGEKLLAPQVLRYIITDYCLDDGCRDLKHHLETVFRKIVELGYDKKGTRVTKKQVDLFLNKDSNQANPAFICKMNRNRLSQADKETIRHLIRDAELENETSGVKEVSLQRLRLIADIFRSRNVDFHFDLEKFTCDVDKSHYGMQKLKRTFARSINYSFKSGNATNLLLVGPPGVGKTTLSKSIADSLQLPFAKISCNGISDPHDLKGVPPHVHAGCCGRIANALRVTGLKAYILLDEIDKINIGTEHGYGVISSLLDLLDMKQYTDTYLGITIDCSEVLFVATANDITRIPPELLDRFEVVQLEGYSKLEKKGIFVNKVLPGLLEEIHAKNGDLSFSDEAIDFMIEHYTETAGVRELKTNAKKILADIILEHNKYCIDVADVIRLLGKPRIERGNRPVYNKPGIVNGLSVNSYSGLGGLFAIETVKSAKNTVTGLVKDSLAESVEIARVVASSINSECEKNHYFTHYAEGAVPKDGPSAGVATTLSILSCEYAIAVPAAYAFTGEIDIFGNVWAVGGVKQKIEAAIERGCTKVFIPKQNYDNQLEDLAAFSPQIEVVAVSNIHEITDKIFAEKTNKK